MSYLSRYPENRESSKSPVDCGAKIPVKDANAVLVLSIRQLENNASGIPTQRVARISVYADNRMTEYD